MRRSFYYVLVVFGMVMEVLAGSASGAGNSISGFTGEYDITYEAANLSLRVDLSLPSGDDRQVETEEIVIPLTPDGGLEPTVVDDLMASIQEVCYRLSIPGYVQDELLKRLEMTLDEAVADLNEMKLTDSADRLTLSQIRSLTVQGDFVDTDADGRSFQLQGTLNPNGGESGNVGELVLKDFFRTDRFSATLAPGENGAVSGDAQWLAKGTDRGYEVDGFQIHIGSTATVVVHLERVLSL